MVETSRHKRNQRNARSKTVRGKKGRNFSKRRTRPMRGGDSLANVAYPSVKIHHARQLIDEHMRDKFLSPKPNTFAVHTPIDEDDFASPLPEDQLDLIQNKAKFKNVLNEHANLVAKVPEFDDPRFAELDNVRKRNRARNAEANKEIRAIAKNNADAREMAWDAKTGNELFDEMNSEVCNKIKSNLIASRCRSLTKKARDKCGVKDHVSSVSPVSPVSHVSPSRGLSPPQDNTNILLPGQLERYFKMLKMQIPLPVVHRQMNMNGVTAEHIKMVNDHHIGFVKQPSRYQFVESGDGDNDDDAGGKLKGVGQLNAGIKNYVTPEALAKCSAMFNEIVNSIRGFKVEDKILTFMELSQGVGDKKLSQVERISKLYQMIQDGTINADTNMVQFMKLKNVLMPIRANAPKHRIENVVLNHGDKVEKLDIDAIERRKKDLADADRNIKQQLQNKADLFQAIMQKRQQSAGAARKYGRRTQRRPTKRYRSRSRSVGGKTIKRANKNM